MRQKLDKASKAALASLKNYQEGNGPEPDWEAGTYETFEHLLFKEAKLGRLQVSKRTLTSIAATVYQLHRKEQGMAAQADDLAYQQWMAEFLTATVRLTLQEKQPAHDEPVPRPILVGEVDSLLTVLNENLEFVDSRRNEPPQFDLYLGDSPKFLEEVRRLSKSLKVLQEELSSKKNAKQASLPEQALREFVLKLCGSMGEGLGKTITWTTRVFLAWIVIHLLQAAGHSIEGLALLVSKNLPD